MTIERRLTTKLMEYWIELKGDYELPLEKDINSNALEEVWDSCFQVQLIDITRGNHYNYSYLGQEIVRAYGCDLSQDEENPLLSTMANKLDAQFKGVLSSRMPMETEGEFINARGQRVAFRQSLLPFSADGVNGNCVFGGMRYRIFEK